jgi:DNA-binding NtrC family response regulator
MGNAQEPLRVLLVDDEQGVADALANFLQAGGYEVHAVCSPIQALTLADHLKPHALVADVVMSEMHGVELADEFANRFPGCNVVLMSSAASGPLVEEARRRKYIRAFFHKGRELQQQLLDSLDAMKRAA